MAYSEKREAFNGPWRLEAVLDRHRPKAMSIIGQVLTSWAQYETQEAILFGLLIGAESQNAAVVALQSIHSGGKRRNVIREAAKVLDGDQHQPLISLLKNADALAVERNRFAHDPLGIAELEYPHDVIWVPAKYIPRPALPTMRRFIDGGSDTTGDEVRAHMEFYTLQALRRLASDILDLHFQMVGYTFWLMADPGTFKDACFKDFAHGPRGRDWIVGRGEAYGPFR